MFEFLFFIPFTKILWDYKKCYKFKKYLELYVKFQGTLHNGGLNLKLIVDSGMIIIVTIQV